MLSEGILVNMFCLSTRHHSDLSSPEKAREGMELRLLLLISRLQAPGQWVMLEVEIITFVSGLTHISQLPHRKLPQSISCQREGEHASVLQLGRQVGHGDLGAVHGSQVVSGVGAETVGVELARLHLPPVQDLRRVG